MMSSLPSLSTRDRGGVFVVILLDIRPGGLTGRRGVPTVGTAGEHQQIMMISFSPTSLSVRFCTKNFLLSMKEIGNLIQRVSKYQS